MVCRSWRATLTADRIWKVLCARCAVPEKPAHLTFYAHFCEHAKSIVGPTLHYRQPPTIARVNLPPKVAFDLEHAFEQRRCSSVMSGQDALVVVDEVEVSLLQLHAPFRWSRAPFEVDKENEATAIPQRLAWTDGVHAVAQSAFKGRGVKMPVKVFQVRIKPKCTGLTLHFMGNVSLGKFEEALKDHTYLMNVFFARSYFVFEWTKQNLASTILCRVELGSLEATACALLPGVSLGSGAITERMPGIAYHNWKAFVLRKFPEAKRPEDRSRLYVYGPRMELLHDYGPPAGENWRYPFLVKVFDPFVLLAYYAKETSVWCLYKVGGPVLLQVWRQSLHQDFLARQISGAIFDPQGLVLSFLREKKRGSEICVAYFPMDDSPLQKSKKKKEEGPHYMWNHVVRHLDMPLTDPAKVHVWSSAGGCIVVLSSPLGTNADPTSSFVPEICILNFSAPRADRFTLKKSISAALPSNKQNSSASSKQPGSGLEALRKELMLISDEMNVDDLMALVKQAKEIQNKGKQ